MTLYVGILLGLLEATSRLYWSIGHGVDFFAPEEIFFAFYPEAASIAKRPIRRDKEIDILLLGGSVLGIQYGNVGQLLAERLTLSLRRPVSVHNVARTAHTTLDSFFKYQALADQSFDVVFVYHGINELRANNCPPEVFREDYSHFAWYETLHDLHRRTELEWFTIPFTWNYILRQWRESSGDAYISRHRPREDWLRYGGDVKSATPFGHNLEAILSLAFERREPVVLASFAHHLPPDYSRGAFDAKRLDYSLHAFPVELWGRPEHVVRGLRQHNEVAERLARAAPHALWVDLDSGIEKTGRNFNDVCHLTGPGCMRFADLLLPAIFTALGVDPAESAAGASEEVEREDATESLSTKTVSEPAVR